MAQQLDEQPFGSELGAAARVARRSHPNCIDEYRVLDPEAIAGEMPVMVLEYLPGPTLEDCRNAIDPAGLVWATHGAVLGLAFLHAHEVAHGRVVPAASGWGTGTSASSPKPGSRCRPRRRRRGRSWRPSS